ncbi:MAG: CCA tRNA nucleotidyltransferase [Chloroflexi bacterium]|nr:CCA tRNA nucleotidyltransferase [Chloroflexota bacterium]
MTMIDRSAASLSASLLRSLPPAAQDAVDRVVAERGSGSVYAVGGAVRDLLLARPLGDIDLVTEDDAIEVATRAFPGAKVTVHARFRTASTVVDGTRIDIATSRNETYARPGGLPRIARAPIEQDLRRRDFSMNAIAVRLDGDAVLLDPCGGRSDIQANLIRVLHDGSFVDDPTRIFRALRYAARLGFALEAHTAMLLRRDVGYLGMVGGERVRRELTLMLAEETAGPALEACQVAGALRTTHEALHWDASKSHALAERPATDVQRIPFGFALLTANVTAADIDSVCARLRLPRNEDAAVHGMAALAPLTDILRRPGAKPSGVVLLLDRVPAPSVAAYAATAPDAIARQLALRYLDEWRHVRPILSGRDLQDLGVPAGPQVQRGLQLIRAARLDGWAGDRGDERALALRFVKSIRDSGAEASGVEMRVNGE